MEERMKLIAQGAEAKLYQDGKTLIKERVVKGYRISEVDDPIRKRRTRREAKVLDKLHHLGFTPKLHSSDDKKCTVVMDFINGKTLRDELDSKNYKKYMEELGKKIALLHNEQTIHGDLTTSNFIVSDEIYFVDFGLSFESLKIEDKAVDLHLLRHALESKHYKIWEECFDVVKKSYVKHAKEGKDVLERLTEVESRGRYKKHLT